MSTETAICVGTATTRMPLSGLQADVLCQDAPTPYPPPFLFALFHRWLAENYGRAAAQMPGEYRKSPPRTESPLSGSVR